jgi:two-component system KDP operon response regulator KdpE
MTTAPHILVIDDEPQILRALKTILGEKNFRVSTAVRGEEGLAAAAANPPDIVILDLGLPDIDGIEVCRRLREWTQCPIIVLSVRESERDKVAALDKGADDYLVKPFGIEELLARVRVALRHAGRAKGSKATKITAGTMVIDLAPCDPRGRRGQADGHGVQIAGLPGLKCGPGADPPGHPYQCVGPGGCRPR